MIEIGFGELNLSKWSMDYTRMPACSLRVLGDTATAIPALTQACRERIANDPRLAARVKARAKRQGMTRCLRPGPNRPKRIGTACRSRCRGSPARSGTSLSMKIGC